jgi:hypothetical protein
MTQENQCRECSEPNDNGEGWDGLCGDCADKQVEAERKKADDTEGGTCD